MNCTADIGSLFAYDVHFNSLPIVCCNTPYRTPDGTKHPSMQELGGGGLLGI